MVDNLGTELQRRFDAEQGGNRRGTGTLQVIFRTVESEMVERPLYHHVCKFYVDGEYLGLSPVVAPAEEWMLLFDTSLRPSGSTRSSSREA